MAERKFKFVSPGVFIDEIDNSQLPRIPGDIGPVIIGRTERGPAMRPVKVSSFSEYIEIFGAPIPGGDSTDVFRNGNYIAPTYAAYAAQAWLRNNNAATIVRLLGAEHTNKTTAGKAGWNTGDNTTAVNKDALAGGGAYGLFMINSSSNTEATGVLAAVLYAASGTYFTLSGTDVASNNADKAAAYVKSNAAREFTLFVRNTARTFSKKYRVNFNESSPFYIRDVLNTNPTLTNTTITPSGIGSSSYWLGESHDQMVNNYVTGSVQWGWIGALQKNTENHANRRTGFNPARTGWVIPQDLDAAAQSGSFDPATLTTLFRFITLDSGEWEQNNLKISIQEIKKSPSLLDPYGTFTVLVRMATDNDNAPRVVERFTECNLNPNSPNYIAKKIGDMYVAWDDTTRRHKFYGTYPNVSRYIRVKMNQTVDEGGGNAEWLPFGFQGAPRYTSFALSASSADPAQKPINFKTAALLNITDIMVVGSGSTNSTCVPSASGVSVSEDGFVDLRSGTGTGYQSKHGYLFPAPYYRVSSSEGSPPGLKQVYWGISTSKTGSTAFDPSYRDSVRMLCADFLSDGDADTSNAAVETSYWFTLDDIVQSGSGGSDFFWREGSRADGDSYRAGNAYDTQLLDNNLDRFTMDLHGGFDGLDIREKEPFRNTYLDDATAPKEIGNYGYNTLKRAIDTVADPEVAEYNLMVAPGITDSGITTQMLDVCEDRGDALAIIDLKGDFVPNTEGTATRENRKGSVATTISTLRGRSLNSSYGCAYFPWVRIRDPHTGNTVHMPPSVVALGTFASSEKRSELWFAPAGFNRGGLTDGAAGLPVVGVSYRLTSEERDKLYAANINPIATFPSEGIVIFGQKTLQVTPSALDRVNVRRLMIHVKKRISRMATSVLFDQNVRSTWNRFLGMVEPFLQGVKTRYGLTDFKVVLDETTTTPDLIDRNIMYAKIFLKPARAIEYIALDFTISRSGAAFVD